MAESGPGCNNLWVTLRSMGLCMDDETLLLMITSTTGQRKEKRIIHYIVKRCATT